MQVIRTIFLLSFEIDKSNRGVCPHWPTSGMTTHLGCPFFCFCYTSSVALPATTQAVPSDLGQALSYAWLIFIYCILSLFSLMKQCLIEQLVTCMFVGMFDRDQSGQIELHEFQGLWNYLTQWRALFDQFDRDRSGTIDTSELNTGLLCHTQQVVSELLQLRYTASAVPYCFCTLW